MLFLTVFINFVKKKDSQKSHSTEMKFNILIFGNKEDLNDCRAVSVDKALEKAKSLNAGYVEI